MKTDRSVLAQEIATSASTKQKRLDVARMAAVLLALLVGANAVFLGIRATDWFCDRGTLANAMLRGLQAAGLDQIQQFFTGKEQSGNVWIGVDRYSDCLSLQLALLGNDTVLKDALAPRVLSVETTGDAKDFPERERCRQLVAWLQRPAVEKAFLSGDGARHPLPEAALSALDDNKAVPYDRFWHGHAVLAAWGVTALGLQGYELLLQNATMSAFVLAIMAAGLCGRRVIWQLAPLFIATVTLGGFAGYARGISYGPALIACWLVVCALLSRRGRWTLHGLCMLALLAGAAEAFFDQMISVPLVAAIFVIAASCARPHAHGAPASPTIRDNFTVLGAWAGGLAGSYAVKAILTGAVLGNGLPLRDLVTQFLFRAGTTDTALRSVGLDHLPRLALSFWAFMRWLAAANLLTGFGRPGPVAGLVLLATVLGWALAAAVTIGALRQGHARDCVARQSGYLLALAIVVGWLVVFPEHSWLHAVFMTRLVGIVIACGFGCAAIGWDDLRHRRPKRLAPAR